MFADPQDLKEWPHCGKTMMQLRTLPAGGMHASTFFLSLPSFPPSLPAIFLPIKPNDHRKSILKKRDPTFTLCLLCAQRGFCLLCFFFIIGVSHVDKAGFPVCVLPGLCGWLPLSDTQVLL